MTPYGKYGEKRKNRKNYFIDFLTNYKKLWEKMNIHNGILLIIS